MILPRGTNEGGEPEDKYAAKKQQKLRLENKNCDSEITQTSSEHYRKHATSASCSRSNPGARVDNIFAVGGKSCLGAVRHRRMEATGGSTTPLLRQIGHRESEKWV